MKYFWVRTTTICLLMGLLAVTSFSQVRVNPGAAAGAGTGAGQPQGTLGGLQKALSLTDSQVSQLTGLLQSQQSAIQPLVAGAKAKQDAMATALQGGNATTIGNAMLARQASQSALKAAQDANQQALMDVLTDAQKQVVSNYLAVAQNGGLGPLRTPAGAGPGSGTGVSTLGPVLRYE